MSRFQQKLEEKLLYYTQLLELQTAESRNYPTGSLRISSDHGKVRYYHRENGILTYLPKGSDSLIRALSQKEYDNKIEKLLTKRCRQFKALLRDYEDDEIDQLYLSMHEGKQKYIEPIVPTWESTRIKWHEEENEGKKFDTNKPQIQTERGELVRSKSEKILADCFFRKGIDYKYEKPLYLKGYGTVYPDFTFLSPVTREEIYWEHEGMMDDPSYVDYAIKKINLYAKNGILQGQRLILTYETSKTVLSMEVVEQLINHYVTEYM